ARVPAQGRLRQGPGLPARSPGRRPGIRGVDRDRRPGCGDRRGRLMSSRRLRDLLSLGFTLALVLVVLVSFTLRPWVDEPFLRIRSPSAVLSLLVALGLLLRARGALRTARLGIGL